MRMIAIDPLREPVGINSNAKELRQHCLVFVKTNQRLQLLADIGVGKRLPWAKQFIDRCIQGQYD